MPFPAIVDLDDVAATGGFKIQSDVMGLRSVLLRTSDHSFSAVTNAVVVEVSAQQMIDSSRARCRS